MPRDEPQPGDLVADKYVVEELIGQGGMGAVYRAHHQITGRTVAVKWLLEDDEHRRARFLREARAMGRLSHPNVVGVLDAGDHEGAIFLVMDYLEGVSLRAMIGEPLPPNEAIQLLMPALAGVAAAHQAGILHRDLKPENLFVLCDRDGTPFDTKVLDFGVAKAYADADGSGEEVVSLTHSGTIVGTPKYMAPEQLGDEGELDPRCDVYALGLILHELLTGKLPYRAKSLNALMLEILTGNVGDPRELVPELPEGLSEMLLRALARDRDERFDDVESFARALEPYAEGTRFEAPRMVHTPRMVARLRERTTVPNKPPSTPPRAEPSEPSPLAAANASAAPTSSQRPPKREASAEALAPTVEASSGSMERRSGAPRLWLLGGAVALLIGAVSLYVAGASDEVEGAAEPIEDAPEEPAAVAEPEIETPEPVAVPEEPPAAATPEPAPAEAPPDPVEAPVARRPRERPRTARRGRARPPRATEEAAPTPTRETEPDLRVRGRSGEMGADDFL